MIETRPNIDSQIKVPVLTASATSDAAWYPTPEQCETVTDIDYVDMAVGRFAENKLMKRSISAFVRCAALTCVLSTPAAAQQFEGPDGSSVTVYGQLNFGIQFYDDGVDSETNFADSAASTSRLGLNYDIPLGDNLLRFKFETALGFPRSDNFSQTEDDEFEWDRQNLRKFEVVYSGDSFGALSFGQGSMATDGLAGLDVAGTSVVATPNPTELAGNYQFRTAADALSGIELDDAFGDFDGPRQFRVRYDTPDFAGFSLAVAYGEEILVEDDDTKFYDVALQYGQTVGDYEFLGGIGYLWEEPEVGDTEETLVASGGFLHAPTGLSLNIAAGDKDGGGSYGWVQIAWEGDLVSAGSTSFSIDYWDGSDFATAGSSSEAITLAAVQRFDDLSLEAYLAYRRHSFDDGADDYQDSDLVFLGTRWRF